MKTALFVTSLLVLLCVQLQAATQPNIVIFLADDAGALVQARHKDGSLETVNTRFVLDASGRDTFLGNRFKAKQRNRQHNSAAIYAHY